MKIHYMCVEREEYCHSEGAKTDKQKNSGSKLSWNIY